VTWVLPGVAFKRGLEKKRGEKNRGVIFGGHKHQWKSSGKITEKPARELKGSFTGWGEEFGLGGGKTDLSTVYD